MLRLLTPQLKKTFKDYPLYSQDGLYSEAVCIAIFFLGNIHWFILEGEPAGDDYRMFGIVTGMGDDEYGYLSLKELSSIEVDGSKYGVGKLKIRQLPNWKPTKLKNLHHPRLCKFLAKFKKEETEQV